MCRILAYLGPPATLESLLIEPPYSLYRQSWQPRLQRHGKLNADGFGVGWYDLHRRPEPARYRSAAPIWADSSFPSMAGLIASGRVMAAVRSATPPVVPHESNVPPFSFGPYLFAHNGAIDGFREGIAGKLRRTLSQERDAGILGNSDSEMLFALVLDQLDQGKSPPEALRQVVHAVTALTSARLNMVLGDGDHVFATVWGDTLFVRRSADAITVASEPCDDSTDWSSIDESILLRATATGLTLEPLADAQRSIPAQ